MKASLFPWKSKIEFFGLLYAPLIRVQISDTPICRRIDKFHGHFLYTADNFSQFSSIQIIVDEWPLSQ